MWQMQDQTATDPAPPSDLGRPPAHRHWRRCLQTVRSAVRAAKLWNRGDTVGWACSGGADSVAGLLVCAALRRSLGHQIVVLHVDHGLTPSSGEAALLVQGLAADLGLSHRMVRVDLCTQAGAHSTNSAQALAQPSQDQGPQLEARARTARYAALAAMAAATGCRVVATAHHADDQAETVLLRLCRGAGPDALAGIAENRGDGVVRPLLRLTRADLRDILADRPHWTDPGNAALHHSRNRIRHIALPALEAALPGAALGLSRTAAAAAETRGGIDAWLDHALRHLERGDPHSLTVPRHAVPAAPAALALLVRWVARQLAVPLPSSRATNQFLGLATRPGAGQMRAAGWQLTQTADSWLFTAAAPNPALERQFTAADVARAPGAD